MTLILNNDDIASVLTMDITMKALEKGRLSAPYRHPNSNQGPEKDLPMGNHGRRVGLWIFRYPDEVRRYLRTGI